MPGVSGSLPAGASVVDDPTNKLEYTPPEGIPVYKRVGDLEDQINEFPKGIAENLVQSGQGLVDLGAGALNTVFHPYQTFVEGKKGVVKGLKDVGAAQDALRLKVVDAFKRGDYQAAAQNALYYMIPLLGPQLAEQGEMAARGEWGRALGHSVATAAQLAAPEMLKSGSVPLSPRLQVKTQLNPVEQANQAFLTREGVQTPLSMQTGSRTAAGLQGSVQQSIGGSQYAQEARQGTRQQIRSVAEQKLQQVRPGAAVTPERAGAAVRAKLGKLSRAAEAETQRASEQLLQGVHPESVTPESAGVATRGRLLGRTQDLAKESNVGYRDAWEHAGNPEFTYEVPVRRAPEISADGKPTGRMTEVMEPVNMPVDVRDIKAKARPIWEEWQWRPASERASNAAYAALDRLLKGDDFVTAPQAEKGLQGLKDMARTENKSGMRDVAQGTAASLIPELQERINEAVAHTGDRAIRGLEEGRKLWAEKMKVQDIYEDLPAEPVQAMGRLAWGRDTGIDFLRKVAKEAPEQMPQIGRALLEQLFAKSKAEGGGFRNAGGMLAKWRDIGPETKRILFKDPEQLAALDQFFKRLVREEKEGIGSIYRDLPEEPVKVMGRLTLDGDTSIDALRRVAKEAPRQMPLIGRALMEELLNRVFREGDIGHTQQALNQWDALGREAKLILFKNANLVDDLDQTMLAMKRLAAEVNPSGSGYMVELNRMKGLLTTALGAAAGGASAGAGGMGLGAAIGGVGGTMALNAGLARLLFNPKYSKMLRQGIQLQLKGDKAGAAAVIGLLSKAANEAPPQTDRPSLDLFVK